MAIALRGRRVLLIDCDFGNRCLDLVAGLSDNVIYDIGDLAFGRVSCERAVIRDSRSENLFFIAAPYGFDNRMNTFSFKSAVKRLMAAGEYDFIFIDTPGGIGEPLQFAASVADTAYIIVEPTRAAIRAADRTAEDRNICPLYRRCGAIRPPVQSRIFAAPAPRRGFRKRPAPVCGQYPSDRTRPRKRFRPRRS